MHKDDVIEFTGECKDGDGLDFDGQTLKGIWDVEIAWLMICGSFLYPKIIFSVLKQVWHQQLTSTNMYN